MLIVEHHDKRTNGFNLPPSLEQIGIYILVTANLS